MYRKKEHQNCMKLSWMANQMIARIRSAIARLQIPARSITHVTLRNKETKQKEKEQIRKKEKTLGVGEGWSAGGGGRKGRKIRGRKSLKVHKRENFYGL
jgi:hypothetical protein